MDVNSMLKFMIENCSKICQSVQTGARGKFCASGMTRVVVWIVCLFSRIQTDDPEEVRTEIESRAETGARSAPRAR